MTVCVFGLSLCFWAAKRAKNFRFAVVLDDDDIKIAGDSFSHSPSADDLAEAAAAEFLQQKDAGNIDKARSVGKRLADAMFDLGQGPLCSEKPRTQREIHHQFLLYSYVVNRVIAEESPNSILAQTALNVFYSEIEAASPELHRHVCDMAAFSLYILCERTDRSHAEIGRIYADLCEFSGNQEKIDDGNRLYEEACLYCTQIIRSANYS